MKSTFRTLFYLRKNRPNSNGLVPIMVRITVNGQIAQFSAKLEIHPDLWDTKLGRAKGRGSDSTNLNRLLDNLRSKMDKIYNKQLDSKGYVLPETIKNIVLGIDSERKTLIEYFTLHNEQYKLKIGKNTSHRTYTRYELTKERLVEFMREKHSISDMMIQELNYVFIESFYLYLRDSHECNNNTAMKFIQRFRKVFNYAVNSGTEIQAHPFANFKFHYEEVDREILTQEEIDLMYHKKFATQRLEQVRDVFVFCCYTGLSYVDVCKLTHANVSKGFDGHLWIMTKRTKTNVASNIRLLDIPQEIIEKYSDKRMNGKLLPSCSNQKMNEYLKEIAELCGINKPLSTHTARHYKIFYKLLISRLCSLRFSIGNDLETSLVLRYA